MNQCSHFEAIGEHPNCRIGRKAAFECGEGCAAYLPDAERTPCEVWDNLNWKTSDQALKNE